MSRMHRCVNRGLFLFSIAAVCGFAGCGETGAIEVESAYGKGIKFDGIGPRYEWAPSQANHRGDEGTPIIPYVETLVERKLAASGFERAAAGRPDFWVRTHVARSTKTDSGVNPHGVTVQDGSLVLDVIDPTNGKIIWRGVAKARLDPSLPPKDREQRVATAVDLLMKRFPAK